MNPLPISRRVTLRCGRGVARSFALAALVGVSVAAASSAGSVSGSRPQVVVLTNDDFRFGTYIIDRPGTYRLGEDISFNPNSLDTLTSLIESGTDPSALGLERPIDAYQAGFPLRSQLVPGGAERFAPGGPLDARYDPSAFGVGFFAAIAITADDVVLDLAGRTIEQSAEHALLQRFFAVVELADQPFVPSQGPSDFGDGIEAASRVVIRNGTIGRSSHHGIHGNGNRDATIANVDFDGYEVAAIALNGVEGLDVRNVVATNRKDVPVLGTFSSAQFIKHYLDALARPPATATTLLVGGAPLDVDDVRDALRASINTTYADVMAGGRVSPTHEPEYGLFHNRHGVVDGNSYSFLVNHVGVAVNGFPSAPAEDAAATDVRFTNVHVVDQAAAITEVPAISVDGVAVIDPVGAVFQTQNRHPATGEFVTVSDDLRYLGNPVANAQAFVAKAARHGEFVGSHLSVRRMNVSDQVLGWIEEQRTVDEAGIDYVCNGPSMFHVNKGVIAFRMDAVDRLRLSNTTVDGLVNLGDAGSDLCGDYGDGRSHPAATLPGYGGSTVRAYTFAGTRHARVDRARVRDLSAAAGPVIGFDVLTDAADVELVATSVERATAGLVPVNSPTPGATVHGFHIGADAGPTVITSTCVSGLAGGDERGLVDDESGDVVVRGVNRHC